MEDYIVAIPKPTDATGVARAKALKANADEVAQRAEELSLASAAEAKALALDVFDPKTEQPTKFIDPIEEVGVSLADDSVVIRVSANIDNMVYGPGNFYTFKVGTKYKVSREIAETLDDAGYIYSIN
jgi:hypothetical protein